MEVRSNNNIFYYYEIKACFIPWQDEQGDQQESAWLWESSQGPLHHQKHQKPTNDYINHRLTGLNFMTIEI